MNTGTDVAGGGPVVASVSPLLVGASVVADSTSDVPVVDDVSGPAVVDVVASAIVASPVVGADADDDDDDDDDDVSPTSVAVASCLSP